MLPVISTLISHKYSTISQFRHFIFPILTEMTNMTSESVLQMLRRSDDIAVTYLMKLLRVYQSNINVRSSWKNRSTFYKEFGVKIKYLEAAVHTNHLINFLFIVQCRSTFRIERKLWSKCSIRCTMCQNVDFNHRNIF